MWLRHSFISSMLRPPTIATLFPYTTLFRSPLDVRRVVERRRDGRRAVLAVPAASLGHDVAAVVHRSGLLVQDHPRSEEHTSELQSRRDLVCRLLLEKKNKKTQVYQPHAVIA